MLSTKRFFYIAAILFVLSFGAFAQSGRPLTQPTPPPDAVEKVATEEIKLNVLAFDDNDNFAQNLRAEDLVINEDGRLHQPTSVRRIAANVLLVLDVGNEISYAKRNKTTAQTASSLVSALQADDSVAVMQYGDKVDVLSEWTKDKDQALRVLNERKLGFGRRSVFMQAMNKALEFFDKTPLENRHLILITDGVDSFNDPAAKNAFTKRLLSSDINVHVISYTKLQQDAVAQLLNRKTAPQKINLPPGAEKPHSRDTPQPVQIGPIINLDRAMVNKRREQAAQLKTSEAYLATLAEDTNGEIFLPDSTDEMIEKTSTLAKNIDSQYVVTYTPKRPLDEATDGEVRQIEVTSRRAGVSVQGRRKFIVSNSK
jgi:VWFA-related protein